MEQAFIEWALAHGVIIDRIEYEKMVRVPTTAHPKKRNGVYYYGTKRKGVCAWDIDGQWHKYDKRGRAEVVPATVKPREEKKDERSTIYERASYILRRATRKAHPYLQRKCLGDYKGLVDSKGLLLVPMLDSKGRVAGLQFISEDGDKRMLKGSIMKNSRYVLGDGPRAVYCEGYATGLSILMALESGNIPARVVVCFCASNLSWVARQDETGVIVADHDKNGVGKKAAEEARRPYWMPIRVGEDANDVLCRGRIDMLSNALRRLLR